jgi:hypothetical protein
MASLKNGARCKVRTCESSFNPCFPVDYSQLIDYRQLKGLHGVVELAPSGGATSPNQGRFFNILVTAGIAYGECRRIIAQHAVIRSETQPIHSDPEPPFHPPNEDHLHCNQNPNPKH